jgi:methionyl-tRNA synthetase
VELARLPPGRKVTTPEVLFRKIEEGDVEAWTERFGGAA